MPVAWLLITTAFIEAVTGIALITIPNMVVPLLFGEFLSGVGLALARLAGVSLFGLGMVAWLSRQIHGKSPALAAMLIYNVVVAIYLVYLGFDGQLVGELLWPAAAIHSVLGLLFVRAWFWALPE